MKKAKICFPLEYWDFRKDMLKAFRKWLIFPKGRVKMVKQAKYCCLVVSYDNRNLYYLINATIHFGAWLQYNNMQTFHNDLIFPESPKNIPITQESIAPWSNVKLIPENEIKTEKTK